MGCASRFLPGLRVFVVRVAGIPAVQIYVTLTFRHFGIRCRGFMPGVYTLPDYVPVEQSGRGRGMQKMDSSNGGQPLNYL